MRSEPQDCGSIENVFRDITVTSQSHPSYGPSWDKKRKGVNLICVDRTSSRTGEWNPDRSGKFFFSRAHSFDGNDVYMKPITEMDMSAHRQSDVIDIYTSKVGFIQFIYTPILKVLSFVHVSFTFDQTGRILGTHELVSLPVLVGSSRADDWQQDMLISLVATIIGVLFSIWTTYIHHREHGSLAFDELLAIPTRLFHLLIIVGIVVWMLDDKSKQSWGEDGTIDRVRRLLEAYTATTSTAESLRDPNAELNAKISEVADEVAAIADQFVGVIVFLFVVVLVQGLQLIVYLGVHPRIGTVTRTMMKAADDIIHFLITFFCVIVLLALSPHLLLGSHNPEFATLPMSIWWGFRGLMGDIPWEATSITPSQWLTVYLVAYVVLVPVILLNFILAIIVEAFMQVKKDNEDSVIENSFLGDLLYMFLDLVLQKLIYQWPSKNALKKYLEETVRTGMGRVEKGELEKHFHIHPKSDKAFHRWMRYIVAPLREEPLRGSITTKDEDGYDHEDNSLEAKYERLREQMDQLLPAMWAVAEAHNPSPLVPKKSQL